jgi:Glycosyl transferase family 11
MIRLVAQGGIGNQLFYWNYAHALNQKYTQKVVIVFANNQEPDRKVFLRQISDYCNHDILVNFSPKLHFVLKSFDALRDRMPKIINKCENLFGVISLPTAGDLLDDLGLKEKIIRGYFQNSESVITNYGCYQSEIDSWLEDNASSTVKLLALETPNYIGIHIRRGDFELSKASTGVLSNKYFLDLLDSDASVIITTDDKRAVPELKVNFPSAIVLDPVNVLPIDSLYILTKAQKLITSNSTFSWWAAVIGKKHIEKIILPKPWNVEQFNKPNYLELPDVTYADAVFER